MMLRKTIKRQLHRVGWQLKREPGWPSLLHHVKPATVIDVGAAYGTPELYESFPSAYHVLIDPVIEYRATLEGLLQAMRGELHTVAIGSGPGQLQLQVDPCDPRFSSLHQRTDLTVRDVEATTRTVSVSTLDTLLSAHGWEAPFFLKLDTEGHELAAIQGAASLLAKTVGVVAEVSLGPRFEGGYRLDEFVAALADLGFTPTNVIDAPGHGPSGQVPWLNLLFSPI